MKKGKAQKAQKNKVPHFIAIGKINLDLTLSLHEEWIKHFQINPDSIQEAKDLKVIFDIKELWDKIQLTSTSPLINTLLFINKSTKSKSFVELLSLNKLQLKEEETFLKELIVYVTEHNFLFIDEAKADNTDVVVTFHLKSGKKTLFSIPIGNNSNTDNESSEEKEGPKFEKFSFDMEKYDFFFAEYDDIIKICGKSENEQNLANNLKIFNDYLSAIKFNNKKINIIIRYPNIVQAIKVINIEILNSITGAMNTADINIFEKKEALAFLNMVNLMSNDSKAHEEYDDKHLEYLFSRFTTLDGNKKNKLGFFIEDFQRFTVIEANSENSTRKDFDISVHPKINHSNQKMIDEYKKTIAVNNPFLNSIFYGGFLSKYLRFQNVYPAFLVATEISKRILEVLRNSLILPEDSEFYIVKLPKQKIEYDIEKNTLKKKEEKFILDCVNKNSSTLKYYNPLFDDHLNSFFSSETIRKQLKHKGFINTNGFVLYDSVYRSALEKSPPKFKGSEDLYEKEKKLLNVIKQNHLGVIFIIILVK